MMIPQKVCQRELLSTVLFKGGNAANQPRLKPIALPDIAKDDLRRLFLKLNIAAFGHVHKAVPQFVFHAMMRPGEQGGELFLKIIFPVGCTDKVQHRQAVLPLGKPQPAAQLLQKDRQ